MAYNPFVGYNPAVQGFLNSRPQTQVNQASWGDPAMMRSAQMQAKSADREAQRRDIEWANQQRMYDPSFWQQAFGTSGGDSGTLGDLTKIDQSPAYQWRYQQGLEALNRTAAAKGMLNSGNRLADLVKYGQGMASQEYDNEFNRQLQAKQLQNQTRSTNAQIGMNAMQMAGRYGAPRTYNVPGGVVTRFG